MLKRLLVLAVAVVGLTAAGCAKCGCKCYTKSLQRDQRQMMDFVDVYFLNYDRNDPFRCDPCLGD